MALNSVPSLKTTNPQAVNVGKSNPTGFTSLSRELRDQIYRHIVVAWYGPVDITASPTDLSNEEGIKAIRAILHSSNSRYATTWFAREAYEVYFRQNIFQVHCKNLPEFLIRKSLYLKNEGFFNIGAWVGTLNVIIREFEYQHVNIVTKTRDELGNELRQLLGCPRLHTVNLIMERSEVKQFRRDGRKWLCDILNAIADICIRLQEKMGSCFKVEFEGEDISWRQLLSP
ncbi:hypothetical protein BDR22DRAFT_970641 [Usnea florida]